MKYILFDAANTLIHKPTLWSNILLVLDNHGYKIDKVNLKFNHKLLSEIINFPDSTSKDFYEHFNSELLMSLGVVPSQVLLDELFTQCSYLPWEAFEDCSSLKDLKIDKIVVSNFNASLQCKLESLIGENIFLDYIVSENEKVRKPSLDFYEIVLKRLNVSPSEVVYVGDSMKLDVIPAQKLGINSYLIDRENIFPNAKNRLSNFYELKKII